MKVIKLEEIDVNKYTNFSWDLQPDLLKYEDDLISKDYACIEMSKYKFSDKKILNFLTLTSLPFYTREDGVDPSVLSLLWGFTKCSKCDTTIKRYTGITGNLKPKFVFIGEAPGVGDGEKAIMDRTLVYGPTSHLVRHALLDLGLIQYSAFTNLLKCSLPNNRPGYASEYSNCLYYLKNEINALNPKVAILFGSRVNTYLSRHLTIPYIKINHPTYYIYEHKEHIFKEELSTKISRYL
jgi:uracil-DNA glycosylase family 4